MNTGKNEPAPSIDWRRVVSTACLKCDWTAIAKATLGSDDLAEMVGDAFRLIGQSLERDIAPTRDATPPSFPTEPPATDDDGEDVDESVNAAATLLGVAVDATADEIRAALRARLSASQLHPDHGGDGEEAKCLIAAKNLLIERAREGRS